LGPHEAIGVEELQRPPEGCLQREPLNNNVMVPQEMICVEELPRPPEGRIQRKLLPTEVTESSLPCTTGSPPVPPLAHRPGVKLPTDIVQSSLPRPPEGPTRDSAVSTGPSKAKGRSPGVNLVINTILEELQGLHHQHSHYLWFADLATKLHQHNIIPQDDVVIVTGCMRIDYMGPWSKLHCDDLPAAVAKALSEWSHWPGWNI
jgi:hypothetical protein